MAHWDKRLRAWLGHGLPENYLTFDYETTGTNVKEDLALDFGFCVVRNKKVVKQQGFVLDWTQRPEWVDPEWLREKLEKLIYIFSMKKKPWVYTWDYLREHGRDPLKVLEFNLQLFQANRNVGALFVGHNAFKFDSPLFQNMSAEYLGETWWFEPDELFDTGCMEKASRSRELNNPRMWLTPRAGESMADFFTAFTAPGWPGCTGTLNP